jgi:excisionase family DNA binding protein
MSSQIRVQRICQLCSKEFIAKTTVTQYCSDYCSKRGYKLRKRQEKIEISDKQIATIKAQPLENIKDKEFLTVRDVAQLLNSSRQAVYDMIKTGRLKAVNLSERKTLIKRSNIDHLFN